MKTLKTAVEDKMRMKTEDEKCNKSEDEDEDEETKKKKKKAKEEEAEDVEKEEEDVEEKDAFGGKDPAEEAVNSGTEGHTTTTASVINTRQNVFVPSSNVKVRRESTSGSSMGQSPSDVSYGKSVSPDLTKSPLFVELNKSIEGMQESVSKKLEAIEKSMNDRIVNMQKTIGKMEAFYESPFYKAIESDNQTFVKKEDTFSEQLSKGMVRFTD